MAGVDLRERTGSLKCRFRALLGSGSLIKRVEARRISNFDMDHAQIRYFVKTYGTSEFTWDGKGILWAVVKERGERRKNLIMSLTLQK